MDRLRKFVDEHILPNLSIIEDDNKRIANLTWEWENIFYNITAPHEGNDYMYMLRVNPKATFDKWGNADIEVLYSDLGELTYDLEHDYWVKDALLETYINYYLEARGK